MRKLIVWNLMSLDGFFEGLKPWDLEFHKYAWGPELEALSKQFGEEGDLLIFGRKTYLGMASYWQTAEGEDDVKTYMNSIAKIAVSRTMQTADWNNSRVVSDPVSEISALKQQTGKTMFVFGSSELMDGLMKAGLIDEIRLCIVPIVLGAGNPLFKQGERQALTLLDTRTLETGAIIARYQPQTAT